MGLKSKEGETGRPMMQTHDEALKIQLEICGCGPLGTDGQHQYRSFGGRC
jgi:hypothetical protein